MKTTHRLYKSSLYLSPLLALISLVLIWVYIIHPQLVSYIHSKIPNLNNSQNYINLEFEDLDISLLKLNATVKNTTVHFKNDLQKFSDLKIKELKVQLNPFELLVGQLSLSSINIDHLTWAITDKMIPVDDSPSADLPLDILFQYLPQIPVNKIKLTNSDLQIDFIEKKMISKTTIPFLVLENQNNRLLLNITNLQQYLKMGENEPATLRIDLKTNLTPENLNLDSISISSADSKIKVKGQIFQFKKITSKLIAELNLESVLLGDNLRTLFLSLWPQKNRIPSLAGKVEINGQLKINGFKDINGHLDFNTSNISVDHFKFGQAQIKMQIKKNQISLNQIHVEHPAGVAELGQIQIEQEKPYRFKTKLMVNHFNLQKLFISLNLNSIPADLDLNGTSDCAGQLMPPFDVECKIEAEAKDIWVKPSLKDSFSILKLKQAKVIGNLILNNEDIQFDSELSIGKSVGAIKGIVDFEQGFKFDFETTRLNFSDIQSLADLDFKGEVQLKGSTWGDSDAGKIEAHLNYNHAELEKFILGQLSSDLKYEDGNLLLTKIDGHLPNSNYTGKLNFDFQKSTLSGSLNLPKLAGADVLTALNQKFYLPFDLSGNGNARIEVSGPFDFWKLKYTLEAHLKKGQIADESFDEIEAHLESTGKQIDFKNVYLRKNRTRLNLSGPILTEYKDPKFNLVIKTNQSYLEEIDHLVKLAPTLTGQFSLDGKIDGTIAWPEINFNFNTKQVNLEGIDYLQSQGQIGINKKHFSLSGQLSGRQIQAQIKWPWKETDNYDIKLQVRDFNPLLFLPLISLPQTSSEYYSRISLDLDLKSDRKNISSAQGHIKLTDFVLQRGIQSIKLKKPSLIVYENGLKHMEPIEISGDDNQVDIKLVNNRKGEPNLDFDVSLKLKLFQFLVPFVDSINGQIEAKAQMSLKSDNFNLFGDGAIVDSSLKLKGFPNPIEGITSPIEFSQSKIFFNDITAHLGSNDILGYGQVDIKGSKNVNVQFHAQAESIELTFPEGITTNGKADISFYGNWLPYNLKINYKVNRGLVEKDFGADSASSGVSLLKGSQYLPPKQFEQQAPSLLMDIAVDLNQGLIVKNKLIEGIATGDLNIKGSPESPSLLGKVELKPGSKLFFKDKPFEIQNANIQFTQSKEINPNIFISSIARVSDYDITLLVQGPAKNLSIKPTSQPPLSESDIISLLALGMTSSKMEQHLSSETQQTQTGIEVLAAISNQSTINKKIQNTLGLTVQLAPSIDSTKNIAVPKVIVSKKIGKKINASYARPLSGDNQNHEVKLQYLFNRNFSGNINYQNKDNTQQDTNLQNQKTNESGILGLDMEYKEEFK